jgi:hypothetical protein
MELPEPIPMALDDTLPVYRGDAYPELGAFLADRVPVEERSRLVFEPSSADELPGRRILFGDEPLCRVVPDPSDPRPLPGLIAKHIEAATEALAAS